MKRYMPLGQEQRQQIRALKKTGLNLERGTIGCRRNPDELAEILVEITGVLEPDPVGCRGDRQAVIVQ